MKYKENENINIENLDNKIKNIYYPILDKDFNLNSYCLLNNNDIGLLANCSNNINQSISYVMINKKAAHSSFIGINKNNFNKCCLVFTIRKLAATKANWINGKDEFLSPENYKWYNNPETDDELDKYEKFNQLMTDSIIYSLVQSASYQSSVPNVTFTHPDNSVKVKKGEKKPMITETIDIKNNFFWMSKDEMVELAKENDNKVFYNHAVNDTDRFVYNEIYKIENGLTGRTFSDEAQAILDHLRKVTITSFPLRNNAPSNLYMNRWDAGWYQIKKMLGKDHPDVNKMNELRKTWEEKNYELLYELGFLLK